MSTTDGWLELNVASCVIRQTRSLGVLVLCSNWNRVFVNYIYLRYGCWYWQFHKFHGRPFARFLYLFLMKDIGRRWLHWVLPGSTGRFYKDDVVHNHSAHGYYTTRMEGGVRYAWHCYMLKQIKVKLSKNAIHIIQELDLVNFTWKTIWVMGRANRCTYDNKTTGAWYFLQLLQQVTAEVQPRLAAQVNSAVSLDKTCMLNITFSRHVFFCSW